MTVRVLSFDFDGCLFNSDYIRSEPKDVIQSNRSFLDTLKGQNASYSKNIVFVGSNRQSKAVDDFNSTVDTRQGWLNKGSCFPAIIKIAQHLTAQLDRFLLADVYSDLPEGSAFAQATQEPDKEEHPDWLFDETKATILYAQMHKIAQEHPDENIEFHFYDDRGLNFIADILEILEKFYKSHPDLIPKNVTLNLHHYAGAKVTSFEPIKGTGFIDTNYYQTVKDMATQAMTIGGGDGLSRPIHTADFVKPEQLKNRKPLVDPVSGRDKLTPQLALIKNKAEQLKIDGHFKAAQRASDLYNTISAAAELYFSGTLSKEDFKGQCDTAIQLARPELERHRGWSEALINLGLVLAGLIGFVIKGIANYANNRSCLFVHETQSSKLVKGLWAIVEDVAPMSLG